MMSNKEKKKCYTITVGLNDKDELAQKIKTAKIIDLVANCCRNYGQQFTSSLSKGGYINLDGQYISENSIAISFIDPDEDVIDEIGKDLCAFLNQECVMVTASEIEVYFISEQI